MRALRIVGIVLGVLVLLVGAAVAAVAIGGDSLIASLIQSRGSAFLGRDIKIGGGFHIDWGTPTRIVAEEVHVANADWGTSPEMFAARRLELEIQPWPLLHFQLVVPRLALDQPKLLLETSADGKKNWNFFAAKSTTPQKRSQFPDLHEFDVAGGAFTWHNGATNATTELTFDKLALKAPDRDSPVDIAAKGDFQKKPYQLAATVGALKELQNPQKPYPVKLQGKVGETKLAAEGTIAEPMDFAGLDLSVSMDGEDLSKFLATFSVPLPKTPKYHLAGKVTHDGDRWGVEQLDGRLGNSRIGGGVAVDVGGKVPYIKANLTSKYLDLADFKGFYGGEPPDKEAKKAPQQKQKEKDEKEAGAGGRVIPDKHLPVDKLPGLNADVSLDAVEVKPTAGLPFQRVSIGLSLKDQVLRLKPLNFAIADGEVEANLGWSAAQHPAQFDADIGVRHIDLKKLFGGADMPKQVRELAGILGGFVKLKSKGLSEREILASANGDVGLFMENGQFSHLLVELIHLDALNALGWWVAGDKPMPVNCLVTRFDVKNGIATASTMLLDTTNAIIAGAGNINFADETLYLELRPHHKTPVAVTFRTPIKITGTFAKPEVHPEYGGIAGRVAAAIGLGIVAPPAALLPLITAGLGDANACQEAFVAQNPPQEPASSGSSKPPQEQGSQAPARQR